MNTMLTEPYVNTRNDEFFRFLGSPTLIRSTAETTNGAFGLMEHWEMPVGFASPYHTHHREDEAFYVLEGEMAFVCGDKWLKGGPGTYVFGPREIAHGFKVIGDQPARMLLMCAPGGFEKFVQELGQPASTPPGPPDFAKLAAVAAKYEIELHGPLPGSPKEWDKAAPTPTGLDGLKSLNRRWIDAFNARNWPEEKAARGDGFTAYLSGNPAPIDNQAWAGFMLSFTEAFPDARIAIDECIAEGDRVVSKWTLNGTQQGAFQGIPGDRPHRASGRN